SPDGKQLASAGGDYARPDATGEIRVWDVATGKLVHSLRSRSGIVWSVAFSTDGGQLAAGAGELLNAPGELTIWDLQTGQDRPLRGHPKGICCVAMSPTDRLAASASADTTVKLWDTRTGQEVLTFGKHTSTVYTVAFSPNGQLLASAGEDKTVRIWEVATG